MQICAKNKAWQGFQRFKVSNFRGKHAFGMVTVGEKGQIVIPAKARKIFDIKAGDQLLVLGDEEQGIAIIKEQDVLRWFAKTGE